MLRRLLLPFVIAAFASGGVVCASETWTAFVNPGNPAAPGSTSDITFSLDNGRLSLNSSTITTVGGSSSMTYSLQLSGLWAVCGTMDEEGSFTADPYATFLQDELGGTVNWSINTPSIWTTNLVLGGSFPDGGASYCGNWWGTGLPSVDGTMVIEKRQTMYQSNVTYQRLDGHAFAISSGPTVSFTPPVPEPSSIVGLALAIGTVAGAAKKRIARA